MTNYGYARVSTKGQAINGNSLEEQVNKLREEGCTEIYEETYTGTKTDRPILNELLAKLKENDTITFTKLDRFARSTMEGSSLIKELFERGIKVNILNMGKIENTTTGRLIFNVLMSFAEYERDMIIERTQEGKAIAKATNPDFKEGRPKVHKKAAIEHALDLMETHTTKQVVEMTGISKATLYRERTKRQAKAIEEKEGN
jgi:DNA invertase Pin-like site-specific DNA recombinase